MNQNPRRPPVQPWIPPRKPQKAAVRTVYVEREKPKGSALVWWVIALAVAQVFAVGVWIWIVYNRATNGTEQGRSMAIAICSLGTVIAVVVLAAVNVTQLILGVVALIRGAVASGVTAMILAALMAAATWAGVLVGCRLALIQGF